MEQQSCDRSKAPVFRPLTLEQAQQMFLLGVALYLEVSLSGPPEYMPRSVDFAKKLPMEEGFGTYAVLEE